jgi:uncharacterized membrane protein
MTTPSQKILTAHRSQDASFVARTASLVVLMLVALATLEDR